MKRMRLPVLALAALASACTTSNPRLLMQSPHCVLLCFASQSSTTRPVPPEEAYPSHVPSSEHAPDAKRGGRR